VVAGETIPTELGLRLPQLVSRLAGGLVLQLKLLSEQDRLLAVQLRAKRRGLKLAVDAGRYLVRRCGQDTQKLFAALEALDQASLAAQRKLTIPFIRQVLKSTEPTLL
jgi:DnaA family protein